MENNILLQAEKRSVLHTVENKRIRKAGLVPAVIFGKNISSVPITVKSDELRKLIKKHGRNAVIEIKVNGDKLYTVIIKNISYVHLTGGYEHVDFQQISLSEKIKAEVGIRITGREALEAKKLLMIRQTDNIKIKGLPQDIPEFIEVDVTNMDAGSTLTIGDIKFPENIEPEDDTETLILSVNEAKEGIKAEAPEGTEPGSEVNE